MRLVSLMVAKRAFSHHVLQQAVLVPLQVSLGRSNLFVQKRFIRNKEPLNDFITTIFITVDVRSNSYPRILISKITWSCSHVSKESAFSRVRNERPGD